MSLPRAAVSFHPEPIARSGPYAWSASPEFRRQKYPDLGAERSIPTIGRALSRPECDSSEVVDQRCITVPRLRIGGFGTEKADLIIITRQAARNLSNYEELADSKHICSSLHSFIQGVYSLTLRQCQEIRLRAQSSCTFHNSVSSSKRNHVQTQSPPLQRANPLSSKTHLSLSPPRHQVDSPV